MIGSVLVIVDCDIEVSYSEFYTLIAEGLKDLRGYYKVTRNEGFYYDCMGYLDEQYEKLVDYDFFNDIQGKKINYRTLESAVIDSDCVLAIGSGSFELGFEAYRLARKKDKPTVIKHTLDFKYEMEKVIKEYWSSPY